MQENEIDQYKQLVKDINTKILTGGTVDVGEAYNMVCMIETLVAEVEELRRSNLSVIRLVGNLAARG